MPDSNNTFPPLPQMPVQPGTMPAADAFDPPPAAQSPTQVSVQKTPQPPIPVQYQPQPVQPLQTPPTPEIYAVAPQPMPQAPLPQPIPEQTVPPVIPDQPFPQSVYQPQPAAPAPFPETPMQAPAPVFTPPPVQPAPQPLPQTPVFEPQPVMPQLATAPAPAPIATPGPAPTPTGNFFDQPLPNQQPALAPIDPGMTSPTFQQAALTQEEQDQLFSRERLSTGQKMVIIFIAIVALGIIGGAGFWLYTQINASPGTINTNQQVDTDKDGLTDAQEATYRTNPNKADTDGDGYLDGEEVNTKHNPLGK
ncbi:MAG: hypothetical protein HYV32_04025 [Candidatus Kerfeldbacteria bacterium]|nr:hypothetical protein [Candidatus Kerfeldbacteria bacterium]